MDLSELRDVIGSRGPKPEIMKYRPISADSHVVEPPTLYRDYMSAKFRDRAPRMIEEDGRDIVILEGVPRKIPVGALAAAGRDAKELMHKGKKFEEIDRGSWDPAARLKAQDADGVVAEIIYPSVGMVVSWMPDIDLQDEAMKAYNRWLMEFCAGAPKRLFGMGQCAVRDVPSAIADVRLIKQQGFSGIYMNSAPRTEYDYDDPAFDPLWAACVELGLPICFHTFGSRKNSNQSGFTSFRGAQPINGWHSIVRDNQDIIGLFIYGGVFERFPDLKLVCVEADAGWAPHFMYRMDHMYLRQRYVQKVLPLEKLPSHYFKENVWLTFQDDWVAFQTAHLMNPARLMWANDFPHTDSTWPWSHSLLVAQTAQLSDHDRRLILHDNVKQLFDLDLEPPG